MERPSCRQFLESTSNSFRLSNNVRLQPYTKQSSERLKERRQAALKEFSFIPQRKISLPECEELFVLPQSLPSELQGVPLEEMDKAGLEKNFCVVTRRSTKCYLYRFSAVNSFFVFSPWNPVRRACLKVFTHRFFDYFVVVIILVNCVFLALNKPIEETEYVFLSIYTIEMIIKSIAKGFILDRFTYLRNAWNWLDFIVVMSGYLTIGLQTFGLEIGNLAGLRTFRVLRALKTVSIMPGLKTIVNAMLHSVRMLAEVMGLTLFCLMVFALLALQLYMGVLRQKCVFNTSTLEENFTNNTDDRKNWLLDVNSDPMICSNGTAARLCPSNYTCLPDQGENPNFGYTNFDSYGWAVLTTLQLITLDYWEDVYNKIIDATGPASMIFFMIVVFFGSFYLVNLTLAVVAIAYEEEAFKTLQQRDKIKKFKRGFPKLPAFLSKLRFRAPSRASQRGTGSRMEQSIASTSSANANMAGYGSSTAIKHQMCMAPDLVISTGESFNAAYHQRSGKSAFVGDRYGQKRSRSRMLPYVDEECVPSCSRETYTLHGIPSALQGKQVCSLPGACDIEEPVSAVPVKRYHESFLIDDETNSRQSVTSSGTNDYYVCNASRQCAQKWKVIRSRLVIAVNDPIFDMVITLFIILNTAFLASEHHGMSAEVEKVLRLGNLIFTSIFTVEAIIKIMALGRHYFDSRWNIFDFVVVILSLLDLSFESVSGLSVLRTFRLLRVVKLAQSWPTMRILLTIIASTLGAVGNMTLVLAVIVYIFAILGMQLFGDIYTADNFSPNSVPRWNFTDFWHSLLMIFRILCGEWVQPLWECMQAAKDKYQICIIFFICVLTVGNFLVLNLFLAMLLNSFNSKELKEKEEENSHSKLMEGFRRLHNVIRRHTLISLDTSFNDPRGKRLKIVPPCDPQVLHLSKTDNSCKNSEDKLSLQQSNTSEDDKATLNQENDKKDEGDQHAVKNVSLSSTLDPEDCCPARCYQRFPTICNSKFSLKFARWRKLALIIVNHKAFEWIVLLLIFASSSLLCFEDIYLPQRPVWQLILSHLNYTFTALFIAEAVLKWMAFGFLVYFTSFWTIMDFVIVCVSVLSIALENAGSGLYALRAIRTLRALRPLRAISRWQGMRIVVNALMSAIPSIFNVLLVCIVFWLIFSIMGVQFFRGKFHKCITTSGQLITPNIVSTSSQCLAYNYTWMNSKINFDNVGNAYLALFQVATFEGWIEITADATDSTEVDHQPYHESNFPAYLYFAVFIICGSFFTLNLFIGVIIDNFNMLKKKYEGGILEMFLTDSQRTYYTAMQKLGKKKPQRIIPRPLNKYLAACYDASVSRRFEMVVFLLIILNLIAMSFEHYQQSEQTTVILDSLNIVFTACFTLEALIKVIGLGYHYFTMPWNIFDFSIIVASIIGVIFEEALQKIVISPTLLRVVRLVRIGRVLRLIKAAKGIRKLLFALIISLPALFNIGALLFLVMFVYAIIGMSLFGHVKHDGRITDTVNFETFAHTMVLLFRLATSAGWNDILEPLMVQPPNCDPHHNDFPNGNCGYPFVAILYLVSYIIINFMVIINMYIAIILENLNQANQEETGITEEDIESFYITWSRYDPHASQFLSLTQLSDFIADVDPPLGISKPNSVSIVAMKLPLSKGDKVHCLDILHALTKSVLGDVDETEEFKKLQEQINERFRKTFPTRSQVEIVSNTWERKHQDNAARVIQRRFRKYKSIHIEK